MDLASLGVTTPPFTYKNLIEIKVSAQARTVAFLKALDVLVTMMAFVRP